MPAQSSRTPSASAFAAVLRRQRESAGVTQAELAVRAGIGVRTVSNLERGINTSPYPSTVRLLADALGLPDGARGDLLAAAGRRTGSGEAVPLTGGFLGAVPSTRLVARDAECSAITGFLAAAAAGETSVVLLAGEPGIGKTRLAQEATVYAAEQGFLVASGRCYEQQSETPFVPLFEAFGALHAAAPTAVGAGVAERWPALVTLLPDQFPAAEQPAWTSPDAAQLLHRAATGLVREIAEQRPVALLFDDLHWADDATLELLTHLALQTTNDRVLLLGTYRDAEVSSEHPVRRLAHALHRERLSRAITVGRLDRDETARLIAQRLPADPVSAELTDLVHRHSDGNPFFTGEILTSLIERGDLAVVDGAWVCRELTAIEAPEHVSEVINQRVARLSPTARGVLEAASVLGTVFDPDDVWIDDLGEDQLEESLDAAVDSGLLTVTDDRYAFDHSLTQQALYAGLSPVRRRRLHRAVGELLAGRPPAVRRRRSAEIARHLETGGLPDQAIRFLELAGDVAAGVYSQDEAVRLYSHAVALAEEVGDEAAVAAGFERLGQVELTTARYDDAVDHLVRAAEGYRRTGQVEPRLRVEGLIAEAQHRRGEGEEAALRLDEVVAELEESTAADDRAPGGAALALGLARVRLSLGQHQLCLEATDRAAKLARREGSAAVEADAYSVAGTVLLFQDRPDDAVSTLERAIALATRAEALTVESGATLALQWTVTMRGDLERARTLGERGLEITRRAGNADMEALHSANFGLTLFYSGDWDQAQVHLEHGMELARAGSPTLFSGIPPVYLGVLRAGQGDADAARASYDEAATAPDLQTFAFAGYLEARRAELDLRDGDPASALARLEPWLGDESPTRIHDVMLFVAAAEACLGRGDLDRAEDLVARALRRAAATRNELDGIDAQRVQGRCALARGRHGEARAAWEAAHARASAVPYPGAVARVQDELTGLDRDESDTA
ncbi:helix-turn-helix domain-containing protein [Nocardioides marmoriginsengisoli]|uniref:Helix-turn-helix domain-containing protein n=1 Tax=Nocardioides marmoriginsengisoli TaxID=661483 RepID=A0A3N0CI13_9ACTN|nr:AAA family ATPase [Nocardioides marmoriginsengisoli]RNL62921.1 helix-turn-helix domain-containing protein [Nocardioides marmoriginsengisoli]